MKEEQKRLIQDKNKHMTYKLGMCGPLASAVEMEDKDKVEDKDKEEKKEKICSFCGEFGKMTTRAKACCRKTKYVGEKWVQNWQTVVQRWC